MVETSMPVNYASVDHPTDVEQRLRRLEAAVAALQDTDLMEDRIVERIDRKTKKSPLKSLRESASAVVEAGKALAPLAAVANGSPAPAAESSVGPAEKPGWLLWDFWSEIRTMRKMIFDHRYKFSIWGRLGPVIIFCLYAFSWWVFSGTLVVGSLVDRIIALMLAFALYKILYREVRRYRAMFP